MDSCPPVSASLVCSRTAASPAPAGQSGPVLSDPAVISSVRLFPTGAFSSGSSAAPMDSRSSPEGRSVPSSGVSVLPASEGSSAGTLLSCALWFSMLTGSVSSVPEAAAADTGMDSASSAAVTNDNTCLLILPVFKIFLLLCKSL